MSSDDTNRLKSQIRGVFEGGGYVFATKAANIARDAGFTNPARLASNENPFGISDAAVNAAKEALDSGNRYPDETADSLVKALAQYHADCGVKLNVVTGVGMDGVIENVIRTFISAGDKVVVSTPTFSFYNLAVTAQGGVVQNVRRREDFTVGVPEFVGACRGAKIAFLCSPNNPTGTITPVEDIEEILKGLLKEGCMLFLDNAYVDFCDTDYRRLMKDYDNLIIGRTMSKAFGLAGMRVGYAFVPDWYLPYYKRAQTPFALNNISIAAAVGALSDREFVRRYVNHVKEWRDAFGAGLKYKVYPAGANFVMIDVAPQKSDDVVAKLAKKGVIVRSCASFPTLGDTFIRVSIGDSWENEMFLKAMNEI